MSNLFKHRQKVLEKDHTSQRFLATAFDDSVIMVLKRLAHRIFFVTVAASTALLFLKTELSEWIIYKFGTKDMIKCIARQQICDNFSFPEVNETAARLIPGSSVGQIRNLYFPGKFKSGNYMLSSFQPGLSHDERQIMFMLFQTFVRACAKFNVTFFLYGGSLLGSYRHHDIIPWDDDIDVMLNTSQRDSLRLALSFSRDQFDLYCPAGQRWKFSWIKSSTLSHKSFRWPYIDVFFFSENVTHIFDQSPEYRNTFAYPKEDIFPLRFHPFAGAMLPVPCKIKSVVERTYSPSLCTSSKYSHKLESSTPKSSWVTVPCNRLYSFYHFANRRGTDSLNDENFCGQQVTKT